jgi:hypothetical protein
MSCKELKTKKYQTRKSPAFSAQACKGLTKKGKDGTYISKADARGIYKWVKANVSSIRNTQKVHLRKGKIYDVLDNGARPYRVYVDGSTVSIYIGKQNSDYTYDYDKLVRTIKAKEVHVGGKKSQLGNSILVHVSGNNYMYIGHEIYEFQMEDTVDTYFSIVGNSDVPYPVLLGTENAYFMLDRCYVPRSEFDPKMTKAEWEDAYQRYYGYADAMTGESPPKGVRADGMEKKCKKMKGFHIVVKRE